MVRFYNGEKEIEIATELEDLSPAQYLYFIALSTVYADSRVMTENDYRVRWLSYLSGLGNVDFTLLTDDRKRYYLDAMPLTDGFFERRPDGRLFPSFDTAANLLPEIEGYKGPGEWLEGMTFGEFTECVMTLGQISDMEGEDAYRAFGSVARVMYRIPAEEPVPEILHFHAPTLFRNVMKRIESAPVNINGEPIDFRIIFKSVGGKKKADDKTGWTGITFEVASSGIFGDLKGVENSDFWLVLLYLYRCKFEYIHTQNTRK